MTRQQTHIRGRRPLRTVAALALLLPVSAAAMEFGVRAGGSVGGGPNYNSQEIYLRTPLPWGVGDPGDWHLRTQLEVNGGRLAGGGDSLLYAGTGVNLWLRNPNAPLSLSVGTGPTYLSQSELDGRDFGGPWQFTSHAAAYLRLQRNLALGYRIQHTSNAGLYSQNPGYNVQTLEIRVGF